MVDTRNSFLPFALPDIDTVEIDSVKAVMESGWLTTGAVTRKFEQAFAASIGVKHAIAVNSCTAAMHLALESIGIQPDDEVITTPYTFAATAEVIRYFGAHPVFVDIHPQDFNLNPLLLEGAATERTRAIIPVHVAGLPADLNSIANFASQRGLAVVEDAAHAYPCLYQGNWIGQKPGRQHAAHAACFSFYATKTITTGEGGMICTDDDMIAERCRIMALHGISKDAWKRYTAEGSWYYEIVAPGYKYNLTDIASAIGIAQLSKAEHMAQRRQQIANRYNHFFGQIPELQIPAVPNDPGDRHAWHLYMLRLNQDRLAIDRSRFVEELKKRNIGTSVHFIPLHVHPYYRKTYGYAPEDFPVAYCEYQREISLPIYSRMSDEDVQDVIDAVVEVVADNRQ